VQSSAILNAKSQRSPWAQPLDQPFGVADPVGSIAEFQQGGLDGLDGVRLVEFGRLFLE